MSVLYDAYGNPFQGEIDQTTGQTFTDSRTISATLAALNAESIIDIYGKAVCSVDVRSAAFVGTIVFEGTIDGTNYIPAATFNTSTGAFISLLTGAGVVAGQVLMMTATGFRRLRVRVSAYTSGNITVTQRATIADYLINTQPIPTTAISATGVAAAAVTLTIPAPAAGLFNYITSIEITRNATAALAGTATLVITTTNLPGTLAWSVGNAMLAGGTQIDVNKDYSMPLRSTTAATATTIVAPAPGAAVLWRINANYFVAP